MTRGERSSSDSLTQAWMKFRARAMERMTDLNDSPHLARGSIITHLNKHFCNSEDREFVHGELAWPAEWIRNEHPQLTHST